MKYIKDPMSKVLHIRVTDLMFDFVKKNNINIALIFRTFLAKMIKKGE